MNELSIIVPTKDRQAILHRTLENLISASINFSNEILIIDNSTSSDILLPKKLNDSRIKIFKNPGNRNSVFASRNFGASIAKNNLLLFLDDDIIVSEEAIRKIVEFHNSNTNACLNIDWIYPDDLLEKMEKIIFGRYVIKNGFSRMRDLMDTEKWKPNTLFNSGEVASYCFSIENKDFKKIGGYEESHLHEGTDEDLVKRLKDSGINMYIDTTTTVFHNESDRLSIWNWMARKERYGEISAFAKRNYKLGNSEIQYTVSKKIIFQFIYGIRKPLVFILRLFPQNFEKLDFVFFKIIDLLLGAHICHGYFKS